MGRDITRRFDMEEQHLEVEENRLSSSKGKMLCTVAFFS